MTLPDTCSNSKHYFLQPIALPGSCYLQQDRCRICRDILIGNETQYIAVFIGRNIFCSDDKIEFENDQSFHCIFQAGDGYLAGLAARFASEFNLDEDDVLHQLEDLRSVLLR